MAFFNRNLSLSIVLYSSLYEVFPFLLFFGVLFVDTNIILDKNYKIIIMNKIMRYFIGFILILYFRLDIKYKHINLR